MRIIRWLDRNLEVALMVVAMIVLIFVMGAQVVARKFLGASIDWSEELGRYLFVWMGFLSISYTIRAKSIIRLEIFNSMLPPAALRALNVLVYGFMLVVFTYLCYQSLSIISDTNQRWSSVNLSMNYVYSAIPVGFLLTVLRLAQSIVNTLRERPESQAEAGKEGR
ncbi:TRAP transporter small permease [Clostridium sp.]|uniref:TRAP transporter small permease n=1 Tax=Clostridium sp. TaxID=1506 RepID=UPI00307BC417